jgi:hypothetical protein
VSQSPAPEAGKALPRMLISALFFVLCFIYVIFAAVNKQCANEDIETYIAVGAETYHDQRSFFCDHVCAWRAVCRIDFTRPTGCQSL